MTTSDGQNAVYQTPVAVPRINILSQEEETTTNNNNNDNDNDNNDNAAEPTVHVISCDLTARKAALSSTQGMERGEEPAIPLTLKEKSKPKLYARTAMLVRQLIEGKLKPTTLNCTLEKPY